MFEHIAMAKPSDSIESTDEKTVDILLFHGNKIQRNLK